MGTTIGAATSHVGYHVEGLRVMVGQLVARYGRCPEFGGIVNGVFCLQVCVMDEQKIADEIIRAAGSTSSWRLAAKALHDLYLKGPCLKGD